MKYAVIRTGGKQYRVSEGDVLEVDKIASKDSKIVFEDLLLVVDDKSVKIGNPVVSGAKVQATHLEDVKGDKLRVSKFKSKVRYRRTTGFRAQKSRIKVDKISEGK